MNKFLTKMLMTLVLISSTVTADESASTPVTASTPVLEMGSWKMRARCAQWANQQGNKRIAALEYEMMWKELGYVATRDSQKYIEIMFQSGIAVGVTMGMDGDAVKSAEILYKSSCKS